MGHTTTRTTERYAKDAVDKLVPVMRRAFGVQDKKDEASLLESKR